MTPARRARKTAAGRRREAGPLTPEALPTLSAFLAGYLHEDYAIDHKTPASALSAFLADASATERRALGKEWRRFLAATEGWRWREVQRAFTGLGGAWTPASHAALDAVFSVLA